jgi:site-specific DNA-methyltransferase (adenine-specific)/site-specific DNA-methyltransferase (cytosine-N4-specific)
MGKIICGDIFDKIKEIPDNSIDLIITSPPYAEKRKNAYGGIPSSDYANWLLSVSHQFMQKIKPSGSFVLNVKEGTKDSKRELYIIEYQLEMANTYHWIDTFIWAKKNPFPTGCKKRLKDGFEYCFQFTKTKNYKFFPNNCLVDSTSKWLEGQKKRKNKGIHSTTNGSNFVMSKRICADKVRPSNVLSFPSSSLNIDHPATFPIALPLFFINLMTEPGDLVLDPFMGSGTTALACVQTGREYIGIDKNEEYCRMTQERIFNLELP